MIEQNFDGLYRYDDRGERFYARVKDGRVLWYPSVTRIIKATSPTPQGLMAWTAKHGMQEASKLRDEAAERGTQMHVLIEEYLTTGTLELDGLPEFHQKALASFAMFCRDHDVQPVHTEKVLYSDEYQYAGACDLICRMTWKRHRIRAMIDFKSGTNLYDDYAVQLGMYWHAAEEHGHMIDRVFNWSPKDWRKEPTYTLTDQSEDAASARTEQIEPRCQLFRAQNDYKPKARMVITGTLPDGMQIRTVDPDEVILEAYNRPATLTAPDGFLESTNDLYEKAIAEGRIAPVEFADIQTPSPFEGVQVLKTPKGYIVHKADTQTATAPNHTNQTGTAGPSSEPA